MTDRLSCCCHAVVEGEFLGEVANRRWPVLIFIFCFDIFCFLLRFFAKLSTNNEECELLAAAVYPGHASKASARFLQAVYQHWAVAAVYSEQGSC
eukprot:GHRR01035605.1.p2 GENE.GHRR01035605.1~~GHRR01035605.1.p2  ORF type:complete len:104 (+),score=21.87 GHRR01035605.1:29-313(+)